MGSICLYMLIQKKVDKKLVNPASEVHFASFLSGGFTSMALINPPERKLTKRTSVYTAVIPTLANFKANVLLIICFNEKPIPNSEFQACGEQLKSPY